MNHDQKGFTLIELMIVVVIISILAAIAYPSYTEFVRRSARSEAKTALLENAQFLERIYTTSSSYAKDSADSDVTTSSLPAQQTPREGTARYAITLMPATTTYTLSATPEGASASDACGTLTLNQAGVKGATGGTLSAAECWNR